jgi:hypothetical protein
MIAQRPRQQGATVHIERVKYDPAWWRKAISGRSDVEVYHTPEWLEYLVASQRAEPVIAVVRYAGREAGLFVGALVRRFGIRILGSPLGGWNTQCMGFLLSSEFDRRAAAAALVSFAFRDLGCIYLQLGDRHLGVREMAGGPLLANTGITRLIDLRPAETAIFGQMRPRTRTSIRQALRMGLVAEEATDPEFIDEYYAQLVEVFARQGLAPTYGPDRVRHLVDALAPTGHLLRMRVRSPDGTTLATSLSVGYGPRAVLWGVASFRNREKGPPNELLHWETLRGWRARGALTYDLGGAGAYKANYGGTEAGTVRFSRSKYPLVRHGPTVVRELVRWRQRVVRLPLRLDGP